LEEEGKEESKVEEMLGKSKRFEVKR